MVAKPLYYSTMDIRIYTQDSKVETLRNLQSITDAGGAFYLSFLDGGSLKINKDMCKAIHIHHEDTHSNMRDEF